MNLVTFTFSYLADAFIQNDRRCADGAIVAGMPSSGALLVLFLLGCF